MKFLLLFGPPAVGKMTVGRELEQQTGLKLFHNHMTIELVVPFFDFGTLPHNRLVTMFRHAILEEVANSDLKGLIFTFVWAFDLPSEAEYVQNFVRIFEKVGAEIYYVELEADLKTRLWRNKTPERLAHKPTKRDTEKSERIMLEHVERHRFNSLPDEFQKPNYLKINNTNLSEGEVALQIKQKFDL